MGFALAVALVAFLFRPLWLPAATFAQVHLLEGLVYGLAIFALWFLSWRPRNYKALAWILVPVGGWVAVIYGVGLSPHDYTTLWVRHSRVIREEVKSLPVTSSERVQPLHAIFRAAEQMTSDSKVAPNDPDVVLVDGAYRFSMAMEPDGFYRERFGVVETVMSMPVTSAAPDFSEAARSKVRFTLGEDMAWSRSARSAAVKSMGLRFFRYVPADVRYLKDDSGEWVLVVSMTHWRGVAFPWPEFGGVVVFRQEKHSPGAFGRFLYGGGTWVPPGDIAKHRYLVGQNLVSYEVSRAIADTFRFRRGFLGPLIHDGDVRISDQEASKNLQPFTVAAQFGGDPHVRLWHYFCLEPFEAGKKGLSVSLFIPADGIGPVRVIDHGDQSGLMGVSAVSDHVRAKEQMIDWDDNEPVEHRPYIRVVNGKLRLMWLTTVVTKGFVAGADPKLALTDAQTRAVVWVDARDPASWVGKMEAELRKGAAGAEPVVPNAPLTSK